VLCYGLFTRYDWSVRCVGPALLDHKTKCRPNSIRAWIVRVFWLPILWILIDMAVSLRTSNRFDQNLIFWNGSTLILRNRHQIGRQNTRMIHVPIPSSRQIVAAMKMVGGTGPRGMTIFPVWMVHSIYSYYFTFCLASIIHALVCSIYQLKRARWFAILLKQRRFRKWYAIAS